jgi:hypothetical protein
VIAKILDWFGFVSHGRDLGHGAGRRHVGCKDEDVLGEKDVSPPFL